MSRVILIMGSKSDSEWCRRITDALDRLGVENEMRVASAHKVPLKCHDIVKEYEKENVVFVTVAGRSNALSGFVDAQTHCPVITCQWSAKTLLTSEGPLTPGIVSPYFW